MLIETLMHEFHDAMEGFHGDALVARRRQISADAHDSSARLTPGGTRDRELRGEIPARRAVLPTDELQLIAQWLSARQDLRILFFVPLGELRDEEIGRSLTDDVSFRRATRAPHERSIDSQVHAVGVLHTEDDINEKIEQFKQFTLTLKGVDRSRDLSAVGGFAQHDGADRTRPRVSRCRRLVRMSAAPTEPFPSPQPSPEPDPIERTGTASDAADEGMAERVVALVSSWLSQAGEATTAAEKRTARQLEGVIEDEAGVAFAMKFVDRVIRPEDHGVAAHQLRQLVAHGALPGFLSSIDRLLLRAGSVLSAVLPGLVMPLAVRRMRQLVGHLVVDAEPAPMSKHLGARQNEGFRLNVNLLGEAVLGDAEADLRLEAATNLLSQPDVDYVSVKVSAVVSQLNPWAFDDSLQRVVERLRPLFDAAATTSPPTFINLDMEEYHDLELTMAAFVTLLDEPAFHTVDAGIVLQAYLPDSFPALQHLVAWANARHQRVVGGQQGGTVKIRLVKGANLAMERVDAAIHGWELAPYRSKAETDANYKRCLDWVMTPDRLAGIRIGVASHNLFDVAWAHLLSEDRNVTPRVEFEMLEGMAPGVARSVRDDANGLLLYTPVVAPADFDVAISYLFRRLEENASDENFIRHLFSLAPGGEAFEREADKFRTALAARGAVGMGPQRTQDRASELPLSAENTTTLPFQNEPDTDPSLPANRTWAAATISRPFVGPATEITTDNNMIDAEMRTVRSALPAWAARSAEERRFVLHAVAAELGRRRGDLVNAMVHEGNKTIAQADIEIAEAIDFARWYGDRALDLQHHDAEGRPSAVFTPLGVIAVIPPWNFPVAIPTGGVLSALAAGNGVVFKPAPEVPRCAEIVAECCWAAGVPRDVLRFVRTHDDATGRHLVTHPAVDAVILTGAHETADLFRSWRPDLRVFAETSGKNSLVITPNADLDEAVADLVDSAFGHSGQKCSAASLAICVGDVYESDRFRRQLRDAVSSLVVGSATNLETSMGPMIAPPEGKLERALTSLDAGESWLVEPVRLADDTWTPGVRVGVASGSWFHQTECFGPVLGVMFAADLDDALAIQNATPFGLTGGIHSLDPDEVAHWRDRVEVGNAYVNRVITGAIVQRQPFGGWKRSSIGPGAKAGGPNYVAQLGRWSDGDLSIDDGSWLPAARKSDHRAWTEKFSIEHDPTGLFCESNVFRYRPLPLIAVRVESDAHPSTLERVRFAAATCGVPIFVSTHLDESAAAFAERLPALGVERVRLLGTLDPVVRDAAAAASIHLVDDLVTAEGRVELLHYLREQAISTTLHRHGNILR